jgi:hypothetical protein
MTLSQDVICIVKSAYEDIKKQEIKLRVISRNFLGQSRLVS